MHLSIPGAGCQVCKQAIHLRYYLNTVVGIATAAFAAAEHQFRTYHCVCALDRL